MIKKYFSRFPFAIRGILYAAKNDFGFRTQLYLLISVGFVVSFVLQPLSEFEFLFITLSYVLVFITELQNSALESALDHIHPERNEAIKNSKDMAAGAVLIAGVFLVIVLLTVSYF